jgi:4-hydroxy-2-oxoglutarate aldolase
MKKEFKGIFTALTTPFGEEKVLPEKFRENIEKYNQYELAGYVIGGSTGENVYLTDDERDVLLRTARETAAPGRKLIAGTGCESTLNTIVATNRAAEMGADAALVILPHYYKSLMTVDALKAYFLTIADKAAIPLIIYSIPRNTGITPPAELIVELSLHPNILGIKDSSGNLTLLEEAGPFMPEGSTFLLGAGSILFPGLLMGASGGIMTLAATVPELCIQLYSLFLEGKFKEAKKLQLELVFLNQAVTRDHGVPGAKYVLDLRGYYGGPCRSPLLPLGDAVKIHIKTILTDLNLI